MINDLTLYVRLYTNHYQPLNAWINQARIELSMDELLNI